MRQWTAEVTVDERLVFRFPRRAVAIAGVEREIAMLPRIAPLVPLPIPEPVLVGRPDDEFPWPFFGAPYIAGREALGLDDAARTGLGRPLAVFLRALHSASVDAELPDDPFGRADMAVRVPRAEEQLAELEHEGVWRRPAGRRSPARRRARSAAPCTDGDGAWRSLLPPPPGRRERSAGRRDRLGDLCRGD